jgi:hypothetical protein
LLFIPSTEKYPSLFGRSKLAYAVAPPSVALPYSSVTMAYLWILLGPGHSTQHSHSILVREINNLNLRA